MPIAQPKLPGKASQLPDSALGPIQQPMPYNPSGIEERNRILELRLLHHYTKTTCKAQTLSAMIPLLCHPMWEIDIPQMAFNNDIVLNALLGISAVNLFALNPEDQGLVRVSRSYMDKALSKYRATIVDVCPNNAEPLLVAACLIAHFTWLMAHSKDLKKEPYKIDLQTYQMCIGIRTLVAQTKPWLDKYQWPHIYNIPAPFPEVYSRRFIESALQDMNLLSSVFSDKGIFGEDSEVYAAVASDLTTTYYMLARKTFDMVTVEQQAVTFLHRLPPRYAELLEQEDPIAMTLLARNMAMFVFMEESSAWWIHGSGPNRIPYKAVWGIHGLIPIKWLWTLDFPKKIILKEITLGPDEE
jgi:hypothetical protein